MVYLPGVVEHLERPPDGRQLGMIAGFVDRLFPRGRRRAALPAFWGMAELRSGLAIRSQLAVSTHGLSPIVTRHGVTLAAAQKERPPELVKQPGGRWTRYSVASGLLPAV